MHRTIAASLAIALAAFAIARASAATPQATDEEIKRITAAAPEKARVQPAKPRKVLVFSSTSGFYHDSIPVAAKAVEIMGQKTGAYQTVVSTDTAMFEPETLAQFDAVVFNNTTGDPFAAKTQGMQPDERKAAEERSERLKKSLVDFVKSGKGVVGIHAATDINARSWPEQAEMFGACFISHPWTEKVGVRLDDPAHPLNAAFNGEGFFVQDEIYQFRAPYSRDNLRILLTLDTTKTNMTKQGISRKDNDFAVSWCRSYGDGRLFYCSLGHMHAIFWNPPILQHYLDGIQFALGDLPADTTPSAKLTPPRLAPATQPAATQPAAK